MFSTVLDRKQFEQFSCVIFLNTQENNTSIQKCSLSKFKYVTIINFLFQFSFSVVLFYKMNYSKLCC